MNASKNGHIEIVKILLSQPGIAIDKKDILKQKKIHRILNL